MSEHTERETDQAQDTGSHQASVNQKRHEPTPASHQAGQGQQAPATSEQHAAARPRGDARPAGDGDAVRDMMGGPPPQGDVPDAPGTQIAAADPAEDGTPRVRHVANAVPGKPDGEVDTRS
ncbi:MAG TPA: hypothetical protein VGM53_17780 [Streptosporangiaceae bacterium]|jgi:hypothetical protein